MAKDLAKEIGYIYIDSGAMYRAVTLYCLENGLFNTDGSIQEEALRQQMRQIQISFQLNPETQRPMTFLNGKNVEERIRTMEVSSHVSPVAALDFVRKALVQQQQEMGKEKGIVMDGRDIGTAVFPECGTEDFRDSLCRDPCTAPLRGTESQRSGCFVRRNSSQRRRTRPHRPEPGSKSPAQG